MKKSFTRLVSIVLSLLVTVPLASMTSGLKARAYDIPAATTGTGTIYYVDSVGGNDDNSGTASDAAWQTIDKVNNEMSSFQPGDEILFKDGDTFAGSIDITCSGSADAQILFSSYGDTAASKPEIDGGDEANPDNAQYDGTSEGAVHVDNAGYVTVEGLKLTNFNPQNPDDYKTQYWRRSGIWVTVANNGVRNDVQILNNEITQVTGMSVTGETGVADGNGDSWSNKNFNAAICIDQWDWTSQTDPGYFDGLYIDGNDIHDVNTIGIYMDGYQGTTQTNLYSKSVEVSHNTIDGTGDDGIVLSRAYEPMIEYNTVYNCGEGIGMHPDGTDAVEWIAGVWLYATYGGTMQYNEVAYTKALNKSTSDSAAFDVDIQSQGPFYIQYNYSHDNAGGFLLDVGQLTNGSCTVRYNISQDDDHGGWTDDNLNITDINYTFYNNVFYSDLGDGFNINAAKGALFVNNIFDLTGPVTFPSALSFSNNDFYGCAVPDQGVDNYTADPGFVNPGTGSDGMDTVDGYQLAADSALLGQGADITDNGGRDYWGNTLYTGSPEIGAYESPTDATADTTAPAAATGLAVTAKTDTSLSLAWNASENGVPLSADVYDASDGQLVASSFMENHATITGLAPDTEYGFYIVVKDKAGNPSAKSATITDRTNIAAIILDDSAAVTAGTWTSGTASDAYNGSDITAPKGTGASTVTYAPDLPLAGYYSVSYWLPAGSGDDANDVQFTVNYGGGSQSTKVNERIASGKWVSLGIHYFDEGTAGSVVLTDNADGTVVADAVKFDYQSEMGPGYVTGVRIASSGSQSSVGGTIRLQLLGSDALNRDLDLATDGDIAAWHSGNPSVATVNNGVVTGVAPGYADIYATVELNGRQFKTAPLRVYIGSALTVLAPQFTDANGNAVSSLAASGTVNVSDTILNNTAGRRSATLVAALFSPDGMEQQKSISGVVNDMDQTTLSVKLMLPADTAGCSIKTFVLDSLTAQHSLSDLTVFPGGTTGGTTGGSSSGSNGGPVSITGTRKSDGSYDAEIPSSDLGSSVSNITVGLGGISVTAPGTVFSAALGNGASLTLTQGTSPSATQQAAFALATANSSVPIAALDLDLNTVTADGVATAVHTLSSNVTVTITLTAAQIAALGGATPDVYYYGTGTSPATLVDLHAVFDSTTGTLTFATDHFSTYLIAASGADFFTPGVLYAAHVQNIGWQKAVADGAEAGTEHRSLRAEAVRIQLTGTLPKGVGIEYQAHVQHEGWLAPVTDGAVSGTAGKSLRLEALRITLKGLTGYAVKYRAYVQHYGWLDWVTTANGTDISKAAVAGTTGKSLRIEALEIQIIKIS